MSVKKQHSALVGENVVMINRSKSGHVRCVKKGPKCGLFVNAANKYQTCENCRTIECGRCKNTVVVANPDSKYCGTCIGVYRGKTA